MQVSLSKLLSLCLFIINLAASGGLQGETRESKFLRFEPLDHSRDRVVPVKVYFRESKIPHPVILFSHGLGGARENNAYLGNYWAESGYVAVFMQHAGSDAEVWKNAKLGQRMSALKAAASAQSFNDRIGDVTFVLDQLEAWNGAAGHELKGKLELKHVGMCGHSFGAVTTMAVAGRHYPFNQSFPEPRIDAFFAMSPQSGKGLPATKAFGHIQKPVLCMTGTKDGSPIDPNLKPSSRREVYTAFPKGDKYQLILDGGEHFAFGDSKGFRTKNRNPKHHPAIKEISLQFWNAYLKGDKKAKQWLQSKKPISETGLSEADVWEWK